MRHVLHEMLEALRETSRRAGRYRASAVLAVVYFVILDPTALIAGLGRTFRSDGRPSWTRRAPSARVRADLERPF